MVLEDPFLRRVDRKIQLDEPIEGRQYVAGVDVAAKVDFTAVAVFDVESHEQVFLDRFNRVEYPVLEDRLHAVYKRFNLTAMTIEDNSIGKEEMIEMDSKKGRVFQSIKGGGDAGEFYLIDKQGNLQLWDKEGIIWTAKRTD